MFDKIASWFRSKRPPKSLAVDRAGQPVTQEVMEAVVRVLIEVTRSDSDVATSEATAIADIVRTRFAATDALVTDLVKRAAERAQSKESLDPVFALLNVTYAPEQKVLLLGACWRIVLADGQVERAERRFAVQLRYRLQLSEEQEEQAQRLAELE